MKIRRGLMGGGEVAYEIKSHKSHTNYSILKILE